MKIKSLAYLLLFFIVGSPFNQIYLFSPNRPIIQFDNLPLASNTTYDNESWIMEIPGMTNMIIDSEDNICVIAGYTLRKYQPSGNLLWQHDWNLYDGISLRSMTLDNSGNIYLIGTIGGANHIFISKYQSDGDLLLNMKIEGIGSLSGALNIDSEGNFYIATYVDYEWTQDIRILKFNSSGILLWDNTRVELGKQVIYYRGLDVSENLFLTYKTEYNDEETWYFLKYDLSGNQIWISEKEEVGSLFDFKFTVDQNDDIILRGEEYDGFGIKFFKYNTSGHQLWNKTIVNYSFADRFDKVGNFYYSNINYTNFKTYIVKLNSTLEQVWISNFQNTNTIRGLLVDNDQNVYIVADITIPSERMRDIFITKLNTSGNFLYNLTWGGPGWDDVRASGFDSKNNLYMIIRCYYSSVGYKWYFVKNPISNNKSLEPGTDLGLHFYEMYLITFLTIAGVISIFALKAIIKPRSKNRLNS